jgi:hypothetical protein
MIKKQVLELLEELTQPLMILLTSDANYGTEFSYTNVNQQNNRRNSFDCIITMIIQALILEQMSVTIFMEST